MPATALDAGSGRVPIMPPGAAGGPGLCAGLRGMACANNAGVVLPKAGGRVPLAFYWVGQRPTGWAGSRPCAARGRVRGDRDPGGG